MNPRIAVGFALKNLKANKYLEIPFILSTGLMMMLFYIMASLVKNEYVLSRHRSLPLFMSFGVVVAAIFTSVFVLYANRFLIRRRQKEFALYGILGLEKKHIRRILLVEHLLNYGMIFLISNLGGFLLGKFAFLFLSKLLKDVSGSVYHYSFSVETTLLTSTYLFILAIFVYLLNVLAIRNSSPIELLHKEKKGEGEPKNRYLLLIIGLILLISGYLIALSIEGVMKSLHYFFFAVLLVVGATYALFVSFSIFILKLQKKKTSYFYKPSHFLSVSGMLYRMKSGAIGLASISILSVGVIVTLASTLSIYSNIETLVQKTMSREYEISYMEDFFPSEVKVAREELKQLVENKVGKYAENVYTKIKTIVPCEKEGREIKPIQMEKGFRTTSFFTIFTTLDSYNHEYGKSFVLNKDEILLSGNHPIFQGENLILAGKEYKTSMVEDIVPANMGIESYVIVVADEGELYKLGAYYQVPSLEGTSNKTAKVNLVTGFDVSKKDFIYENEYEEGRKTGQIYRITSREQMKMELYELNGGFLFLGILIGIIFLSGTILITYYKQVSEGMEDREKYLVMKKVGLPDSLIRKTANAQIIWMFFLPLAVAVIHSFVASKIIFQLLGLFGIKEFKDFGLNLIYVTLSFAFIYFINFKITSNIYYKYVR